MLTRRQIEVVRLIGQGLTSQEIALQLGVRPKTVENYKQRVFVRLGVQNQAHAVARCARMGLMDDDLVASLARDLRSTPRGASQSSEANG